MIVHFKIIVDGHFDPPQVDEHGRELRAFLVSFVWAVDNVEAWRMVQHWLEKENFIPDEPPKIELLPVETEGSRASEVTDLFFEMYPDQH